MHAVIQFLKSHPNISMAIAGAAFQWAWSFIASAVPTPEEMKPFLSPYKMLWYGKLYNAFHVAAGSIPKIVPGLRAMNLFGNGKGSGGQSQG